MSGRRGAKAPGAREQRGRDGLLLGRKRRHAVGGGGGRFFRLTEFRGGLHALLAECHLHCGDGGDPGAGGGGFALMLGLLRLQLLERRLRGAACRQRPARRG